MTWLSTWPHNGIPTYREHDTEDQAAAHADHIVRSDTARIATYYELDDTHIDPELPIEEQAS